MNRDDIKTNLQKILVETHWHEKKHEIVDKTKGFSFSCPMCGDSDENTSKKRAGVWFDKSNPYFYCHHECGGISMEKFFKHFNIVYNEDIVSDFFSAPISVKPTYKYNPRAMALSEISRLSIPVKYIEEGLKCERIIEGTPCWKYLESRNLLEKIEYFRYWPKYNRLIILNTLHEPTLVKTWNEDGYFIKTDCNVIGFQARALGQSNMKYITYTLEKLCGELVLPYNPKPGTEEFIKKLSATFFSTHVDWTVPVLITEGPIDALFLENSIALTGVSKSNLKIDTNYLCEYIFDNDDTGKREQTNKSINYQKRIFNWNKLCSDINADVKDIKDINDVVNFCAAGNITLPIFKEYFI